METEQSRRKAGVGGADTDVSAFRRCALSVLRSCDRAQKAAGQHGTDGQAGKEKSGAG